MRKLSKNTVKKSNKNTRFHKKYKERILLEKTLKYLVRMARLLNRNQVKLESKITKMVDEDFWDLI